MLAWMNYLDRDGLLPLALLACICHEAGHYVVIRMLGYRIAGLRLSAAGADMSLASPMGYWQEILSAGAGPAVNLILYVLCSGTPGGNAFAGLNLILGLFNLIPAAQLDGGRILSCLLFLLLDPRWADMIKCMFDRFLIVMILTLGTVLFLFCGNSSMLLVAIWLTAGLFMGKKGEIGLAIRNRNR